MKDQNAEEKILAVADTLFSQKGYAATSIRDIANAAEVNPALINYYYKSKESLFAIVMKHKVKQLFGSMLPVLQDDTLPLDKKTEAVVAAISRVVAEDANLPMFVFGELQKQDVSMAEVLPAREIRDSSFVRQLMVQKPDANPFHYILNLFALTVVPYIILPMWTKVGLMSGEEVAQLLKERTELIPQWMKQTLSMTN